MKRFVAISVALISTAALAQDGTYIDVEDDLRTSYFADERVVLVPFQSVKVSGTNRYPALNFIKGTARITCSPDSVDMINIQAARNDGSTVDVADKREVPIDNESNLAELLADTCY
jgi:hypothetical protein